jgi:hypothetical protein
MQALSTVSSNARRQRQPHGTRTLYRLLGKRSDFALHDARSLRRPELENYTARCFERAYRAEVTDFAPLLLELCCTGSISGVAGVRPAGHEPLFLEHYLDEPVERVATAVAGQSIGRHEIVELCNLAALRPGACQLINIMLATVLYGAGFRYAGLVSTAQLERIVRKQHFVVESITAADPARLGAVSARWGSYYDSEPNVILVDLSATMAALHDHRLSAAIIRHYATTIDRLVDQLRACNDFSVDSPA